MRRRNNRGEVKKDPIGDIIKLIIDHSFNFKESLLRPKNKVEDLLDTLVDYPSLTEVLPYYSYDREKKLFINKGSVGFIIEVQPLVGANENIVKALDEFLRTKFPRKQPLQVTLLSSKEVKDILDYGLQHEKWKGNNADHFNDITSAYYQKAALNSFDNARGYGLTLRNYRVFITYGEERKGNLANQLNQLEGQLKIIKSGLEGAFLFGQLLGENDLLRLVREIASVDMDSVVCSPDNYNENEPLDVQCLTKSTKLVLDKNKIVVSSKRKELAGITETIVSNFLIDDNNPDAFYLGLGPNNIASLTSPSLMISCPFVITFIVEIEDQVKAYNEINSKYLDRDRKSKTSFAKFVPQVQQEAEEYQKLRLKLSSNETSLAFYYYNITIFSRDEDEAKKNEQSVLNAYRNNGIQLSSLEFMNIRNYLSMFPFMCHEGLWYDIKKTNAHNRCEVFQAVNLMPVVAENKLAQQGFLAPSFRNQVSFVSLFDMQTDNYNCAITGTAGAGKSVITQTILYDIYNKGGREWIIDLGDSYKNYCEIVGGEYWDAANLKFNPFANISKDIDVDQLGEVLMKIHKLILVMADPEAKYLDQVAEQLIFQGVEHAYYSKRNKARIDDVVDYFMTERNKDEYGDKDGIRARLDEAAILLQKYTSRGIYGKYFNSDDPTVTGNNQLTVLELGSLQGTPDLLAAVLYTLIISIDEYMYQSSRAIIKVCAIDEAWRLLGGKSQRVADFIEVGYRTARKHNGSFITITQGLNDFSLTKAASAAWDNSSIKIIARQDTLAVQGYIRDNPNFFKSNEVELLKSFGNASHNRFSSFFLAMQGEKFPCRLFLDPLRRTLFSSTGADFDYIQKERLKGVDISSAIFDRAVLKFPDEIKGLEQWIEARKSSL